MTDGNDHLADRQGKEYPEGMTLPDWAADVASKLSDTNQLVIIEGERVLDHGVRVPALYLARWHIEDVSERLEVQPLAIILDESLQESVVIGDDSTIHHIYPVDDDGEEGNT